MTAVYRTKTGENGCMYKYKLRWNIRGDKQKPHAHYDPQNISSPIANRDTIFTALSFAATNDNIVEHLDNESAFLHELLGPEDQVYEHQLPILTVLMNIQIV